MTASAAERMAVDPAVLCGRADQLMRSGGYDEAIALYGLVLDVRPDHAVAANNMGNAYQKLGRFGDAVSCYRRARDAQPDNAAGIFQGFWGRVRSQEMQVDVRRERPRSAES